MILLFIAWISNQLPMWQQVGAEAAEPIAVIALIITGIIIAFGAAGMRISENLGATVIGGIFGAIGYVCRTIIQAIGWVIRQIATATPRVYRWARNTVQSMGASKAVANLIGAVVAIVFLAIII